MDLPDYESRRRVGEGNVRRKIDPLVDWGRISGLLKGGLKRSGLGPQGYDPGVPFSGLLLAGRCCQTNANLSQQGQDGCPLCGAKATPLSESGGAVPFEIGSWAEAAFRVEEVVDRGVDGGELL